MGGGGSTTQSGTIAPELRNLFMGSANSLLGQQEANPITDYNAAHPLQVEGSNPWQQMGAGMIAGGGQPSGLDALSLQSILRMPGLAGAGPTTGQYDYGSEAGLGDLMGFMNPTYGVGGGVDQYAARPAGEGFRNMTPDAGYAQPRENYGSLSDVLRQPPPTGGPGAFGLPTNNNGGEVSPSFAGYGGQGGPGEYAQRNPTGAGVNASTGPPGANFAPSGTGMSGSDILARAQSSKPGGIQAGWGTSLSDLNTQTLNPLGITASGGGMGGLNLSGGGRSYTNVGGSHEGAGPGGQSQFLSDVLGNGGDRGSGYRANAGVDSQIAGVAQRMRNAESSGMDANISPEALAATRASQRAADPALAAWAARRAQGGGQTPEQTLAAAQPNRRR